MERLPLRAPRRIEFVGVIPDVVVKRLNVVLEGGAWDAYELVPLFTSLSEAGHASLDDWSTVKIEARLSPQIISTAWPADAREEVY